MKDDDVRKEIESMAENRKHYSNTNNPIDFPKIQAGADIHAGDGGYNEGNKEDYEAFVKVRNKSLAEARIKEIAVDAGMISSEANGFDRTSLLQKEKKFAELIVRECMTQIQQVREIKAGHAEYTQGFDDGMFVAISTIEDHFGVEP